MSKIEEQQLMTLALQAAVKGQGRTWQNPLVGAVIVKDGQVLATGYHHQFGQAHAEIDALNQLSNIGLARGATMVVTLEPCSHYGKTPPCARRLVEVGIVRVIIGQRDPNPLVSGKGIAILKAAGIDVTVLDTPEPFNDAYNFFYQHQRPLVTAKYAMSLDGKINGQARQRTILTGIAAYQDSQRLRAQQQAILVGEGTLLTDDPQLTVRTKLLPYPPVRIVLVNDADAIAPTHQLFKSAGPVWLLSRQASHKNWPDSVRVMIDAHWQPARIMRLLKDEGVQSLLVEGGSRVLAQFAAANLLDRMTVYLAPLVIGGTGLSAMLGTSLLTPTQWRITAVQPLAEDLRIDATRKEVGTCLQEL